VLDRRTEKNASTGLFELAYRQPLVSVPSYVGASLMIEGQIIKKPNSEGGAGKKTNNDGGQQSFRERNMMQSNKFCCVDEPMTLKLKAVNIGTMDTRALHNRTSLVKTINSSVAESYARHKLSHKVSVDSAVHEKLEGSRATNTVRDLPRHHSDQQKSMTAVATARRQAATRNRTSCNFESSDSDSEQPRVRIGTRPKTTYRTVAAVAAAKLSASTTFKPSITERRRSSMPTVSETAAPLVQQPMTSKRRKSTRPKAARQHRHQHSRVHCHHTASSDADIAESGASDHEHDPTTPTSTIMEPQGVVLGQSTSPSVSTDPPTNLGREQPTIPSASRRTTTKPVSAACSVMLTAPTRPSRRHRQMRTPSFNDVYRNHLTSSVSTAQSQPSIAVYSNVSATAPRVMTDAFRPHTLLLPSSSFPAHHMGTPRHLVLPADCLLRHSQTSASTLQFMPAITRSLVMRGRDFSDLQASMQVIGLGNTT